MEWFWEIKLVVLLKWHCFCWYPLTKYILYFWQIVKALGDTLWQRMFWHTVINSFKCATQIDIFLNILLLFSKLGLKGIQIQDWHWYFWWHFWINIFEVTLCSCFLFSNDLISDDMVAKECSFISDNLVGTVYQFYGFYLTMAWLDY